MGTLRPLRDFPAHPKLAPCCMLLVHTIVENPGKDNALGRLAKKATKQLSAVIIDEYAQCGLEPPGMATAKKAAGAAGRAESGGSSLPALV